MTISAWSTTPANNNSSPPNGAPEGWAPSKVNDTIRQQMADHKTQWLDAEWFNDGSAVSRASTTSFKITTDVTGRYLANRRIKFYDSTTLYGTVTSSSYSAPDTTINVEMDSGTLSTSLTSVALAILTPTSTSVPSTIGRKAATVASATTTDLSAIGGDFVDVSGTTTITGLGTVAAGVMKTVRFTGALTLTHNATSLILPGAVNITTANGDVAIFRSLGSGNWVCTNYCRASTGANTVIGVKGADIASAGTVDLSTATGDYVDITGTTTITAFGTMTAGITRTVRFTGALTLTYNASSLILPGSANITTANGDFAVFRSLGSGNWQCVSYTKRDGTSLVASSAAPFSDASAIIKNSSDATKLILISAANVTTGTTRIWTSVDRNITVGNNWEFIASATASSSATIDFSSIAASTYARHIIVFNDVVPATNAVVLYFRMSTASAFKSGASDYQWVMYAASSGGAGATSSTGAAQIALSDTTNTLGTAAHQLISGQISIFNAANASEYKRVHCSSSWISSGGLPVVNMLGGVFQFSTACDGFRFLMSSGNIASGTFYLYGQRTAA